jgi:hypothetical protein
MATASLMLKGGTRQVTVEELARIPCPEPQGRWRPVPHSTVLTYATTALRDAGYQIDTLDLGTARDDERFFATMVLSAPLAPGVSTAVGIRSSIDKSISLQWCCGSRVFVCSNMAFASQTVISRKHTTNGVERYQEAIAKAVSGLAEYRALESARIKVLQHTGLKDVDAESYLLRAYEQQILSPRTLPTALAEWRKPSFEEFADRTAWNLFNAVTFALAPRAKSNPQAHAAATVRLGGLLLPEAPTQATAA